MAMGRRSNWTFATWNHISIKRGRELFSKYGYERLSTVFLRRLFNFSRSLFRSQVDAAISLVRSAVTFRDRASWQSIKAAETHKDRGDGWAHAQHVIKRQWDWAFLHAFGMGWTQIMADPHKDVKALRKHFVAEV